MITELSLGSSACDRFLDRLAGRIQAPDPDMLARVETILAAVRTEGDAALCRFSEAFDGFKGPVTFLTPADCQAALEGLDPGLQAALDKAARHIRAFHERQLTQGFVLDKGQGVRLEQRVLPLRRVGLYVPGGRAAYPSTVLMNAIPARIAGVEDLIVATPPGKEGLVNPMTLAACAVAGVDRVLLAGGAQACAALAYGTASVPKVDKITGPGNAYVATAKRLLYGTVDIDMIAGPSEIVIVAEAGVHPAWLAADLLGQCEHDPQAAGILITPDADLARAVRLAVADQVSRAPRAAIIKEALANYSAIIVTQDLDAALALANDLAPEHLELVGEGPESRLDQVRHAGSVFLGPYTPEAVGDYMAGTNHVLPTGGTARFFSPLGVEDFTRRMQVSRYSRAALAADAPAILAFAEAEGLYAHGRSVEIRRED
ncbi:histidinol dehydrogenase [Peptococcus simiae]|uniref:histidinol dehydrogenase n=1 Tax=Peptococcus simiae TaxID=1643805 RepID=UPI0039813162